MSKVFKDNPYFKSQEFDSPDLIGSGNKMDKLFIKKLTQARVIADIPFIINSGYRTKSHNKNINGKLDSSHCKGLACDIAVIGSRDRFLILNALILVGFKRIGLSSRFIHVDLDSSKAQEVFWLYPNIVMT